MYTRVSTEDQAKEGFSLRAQRERLEAFCKSKEDWQVVEVYEDDGYSGRDTNRPAYQRMLAEMDRWDVLLVLKMDRIHRNSKAFMEMMDTLEEADKEFASATESLDTTTAMGRFVVDIIQRIAQLESEQIGERVKAGMAQKAKESGSLGGAAPYGYERGEDGLRVVEAEAEIVRWIFETYRDGASLQEIVAKLRDREVPTKNGGRWARRTVSKILNNPLYAGVREWDGIRLAADHVPVVSTDLFNDVQNRLSMQAAQARPSTPQTIGPEMV